ncbi:MAG: hypothetical protein Fur0014_09460 [Rubrivivax sp.]
MGLSANTPRPCTPERRTWMRLPPAAAAGFFAGWACAVFFIRYIEIMGARMHTCVREAL